MVYDGYLEGLTVRLRSVTESDAEVTFKMRSDPEKARFIHPPKGNVEDQRNYIHMQRQREGDWLFLIEDLKGKPIGMKGVYGLDRKNNQIETGRFVGYGSQVQNIEALKLGFDFAFEILDVDKVVMSALENNDVMLGIQKKFGVEFTYRDRYEGLEFDNLHSVLTKEKYYSTVPKVQLLIQRFANR